ncbi:arylsulfatase [Flavilitoribacter nigricans]|uniref:N-acetylgalactosamine-6-sulfatase n=1 Tax=Flavilitoribacter nigricans (strain ATCC 23147 / DSM 23189 / NBRC 102662 / NCIMB 1420 / SS-2) TaxID=1122177 RepID=A0A2D0NIJ0_FLAN2|nr:arylsulfatase [Flavilitoribacter nigricans]PHN08267.1 N-acetylgalactosamine-6-sulfatase [Flavilitoribacter nigricans DSM 23189 = NBRC 102662]
MKTYRLPAYLLPILLLFLFSSCGTETTPESGEKPGKPNIVYILADDLGYGDIEPYGQETIKTPYLRRLAEDGMRFTQHYAGSTVCAPSRCVLMTGKHTGHARIRGNGVVPLLPEDLTIGEMLKDAGYATAVIGKWGLGEAGSTGIPNRQGFDYFYGYLNQIRAHNSYPDYLWENETKDSLDNVVTIIPETYAKGVGGIALEKNTFAQDVFMDKALDFIRAHRDTSFFLYLPFTAPHANNESHYYDEVGIEVPKLGVYAQEDWPEAQKAHAALISYLDIYIGQIIEAIQNAGIDENTIVIFSSDNGPHEEGGAKVDFFDSNGPLRGTKRDLYEGGIRVPMIVRWPGKVAPGTESDHLSTFWDVMPTLAEIAGTAIPEETDGISFLPTLLGDEQPEHDHVYWEFYEQDGKKAVRWGDWKLVELGLKPGREPDTLLYDLSADLGETRDLSAEKPELVREGFAKMKASHTPSTTFSFE